MVVNKVLIWYFETKKSNIHLQELGAEKLFGNERDFYFMDCKHKICVYC